MGVQHPNSIERATMRKVCARLAPFVGLMFFIHDLDRTAISFAGPNGLSRDLGMTAAQFGFASGVFFMGYIILINTVGNVAGFGAPYVTGLVRDWPDSYDVLMCIVGAFMALSGLLGFMALAIVRPPAETSRLTKMSKAHA